MGVSEQIVDSITRQFASTWDMVRQAIDNIPDEDWRAAHGEWCYATTAFHIVETVDFYSQRSPDGFDWGGRFDIAKNGGHQPKNMPSKKELLDYLDEMEKRIVRVLRTPEIPLRQKDGFHWFESVLEKLLYALRHTVFHTGELALALRTWKCKKLKWT
ncbi:MAG: DinB family protein [Candidatus Thorarchaeota archaeon]